MLFPEEETHIIHQYIYLSNAFDFVTKGQQYGGRLSGGPRVWGEEVDLSEKSTGCCQAFPPKPEEEASTSLGVRLLAGLGHCSLRAC